MGVLTDALNDILLLVEEGLKRDEERIAALNTLISETEKAMAECQREMEQELML